jgi:hypothetical protein
MQFLFKKGKELGRNDQRIYLRTNILIIGGGIIGMNIAKCLATEYPNKVITLIER